MRGAGSTYNDILDRKLDAGVERTRGRPLPSGRVGVRAAAAFLVAQSLIGLVVLIQFNLFSILLGIASLGIVAVYPLMKRVTSWPQAVLGLAFSWGALIGWSATFASLALAPVLLYVSAFAWTIGYDTVYAMQDARDDAIVGIRSTARLFEANTRLAVGLFYARRGASGAERDPSRRRRRRRADRLARLCGASRLAGLEGRWRRPGHGAPPLPLQPRRRPSALRRHRRAGLGGVRDPRHPSRFARSVPRPDWVEKLGRRPKKVWRPFFQPATAGAISATVSAVGETRRR